MDKDKLHKVYIPHLKGQLEQGQALLFTGAGFSSKAQNQVGTPLPLGEELAKVYWDICYPGKPFDSNNSLQDLFEQAHNEHAARLTAATQAQLSVRPDSVPAWYGDVLSLPWRLIYTLNIDDLAVAASKTYKLPRACRPISAIARSKAEQLINLHRDLNVVHLNGTLNDLPDGVTFSLTQYAERLAAQDPWYLQVASDLLSRCVVFVGTKLDEPPLWQHIALRGKRGRGIGELRHRSYLVTPNLPASKQARLESFNVVWLPFTAEEFYSEVLAGLAPTRDAGLATLERLNPGRYVESTLHDVASLAVSPLEKTQYLLGQEPKWSDIQSGRAIARVCDAQIADIIGQFRAKVRSSGIILISGTAGSGKSTSLMRACLAMASAGTKVAWVDRDSELSPRAIVSAMRADGAPTVIGIDDAAMYGNELTPLIRDIAANKPGTLVLIEARAGQVDKYVHAAQLGKVQFQEISMPHLADGDISSLLDVLVSENRLGELRGKPRPFQEKVFRDLCGRELIVAMYKATTGLEFKEKMVAELTELGDGPSFIYAVCALATAHRHSLTRDEILIASGDKTNTTLGELDTLVRRGLLKLKPDSDLIAVRHRLIAETIVDSLTQKGQLFDVIAGLLLAMTAKVSLHARGKSREWRILKTFINHEFLSRSITRTQTRNLYADFETSLSWDYHYWLHRGAFEVEFGEIALAENFLGQARALAPHDAFVTTEWAYLLFKKACTYPGAIESPKLVEEATGLLDTLISSDGYRSPYAFHILGSQGLSWARRGISSVDARKTFLRELQRKLDKGVEIHGGDKNLKQLSEDLTKEMMSLAVPGAR